MIKSGYGLHPAQTVQTTLSHVVLSALTFLTVYKYSFLRLPCFLFYSISWAMSMDTWHSAANPRNNCDLKNPAPCIKPLPMANDMKLMCTFKLTSASVSLHSKLQLSDCLLYGMIKFKVMLPYLDIHLLHRKHTLFAFVLWGVTSWLESESRHMDGDKTNPNVHFVSQNLIGYMKI